MPSPDELDYWMDEVSTVFTRMSTCQARVLALYSYGMALTQRCGQSVIVTFLGLLLDIPLSNLRQRLREWNYDAEDKRGRQRQAVAVEQHFAALLAWVLHAWERPKRVVLALDVTYLRDRHTILVVSVVYRRCAIPVAWRVLPARQKGEWHPLWLALLASLAAVIPKGCAVGVLCDEGLYSKRLFEAITQHGWHPLMRVGSQGMYHRRRATRWLPLATLVCRGMKSKNLRVVCFKTDPLLCTLSVHWPSAYDRPCLLVTDLPPKQLKGYPYALRSWVECGFKDLKRGGLRWEQSKTVAPQRMERLLFVMAVALVWLIREGSAQVDVLMEARQPCPLSCTTLGWLTSLVSAIRQRPLPSPYFSPYSFPPLPS